MPPFTDAALPEVCARVAVAWVKFVWRQQGPGATHGPTVVQHAIDAWPLDRRDLVPTALSALQFHLIRGGTSQQWLAHATLSSRAGYGFRRCWYEDYKGTRRANPRVTNRGVRATTLVEE